MKHLITLCLIVSVGCGKTSRTYDEIITPEMWETADVKQEARTITSTYAQNELQGDAKYKGKLVAAVGRIVRVSKGTGRESASVTIETGVFGTNEFKCYFSAQHENELIQLPSIGRIMVVGRCEGRDGSDVLLTRCRVAKLATDENDPAPWAKGEWVK